MDPTTQESATKGLMMVRGDDDDEDDELCVDGGQMIVKINVL